MGYEHREDALGGGAGNGKHTHTHTQCPPCYTGWLSLGQRFEAIMTQVEVPLR